jgi:hypothetical protein
MSNPISVALRELNQFRTSLLLYRSVLPYLRSEMALLLTTTAIMLGSTALVLAALQQRAFQRRGRADRSQQFLEACKGRIGFGRAGPDLGHRLVDQPLEDRHKPGEIGMGRRTGESTGRHCRGSEIAACQAGVADNMNVAMRAGTASGITVTVGPGTSGSTFGVGGMNGRHLLLLWNCEMVRGRSPASGHHGGRRQSPGH